MKGRHGYRLASVAVVLLFLAVSGCTAPTPAHNPTPTPVATSTPARTPTPTPAAAPSPSPTATPSPTPTPGPAPSATPVALAGWIKQFGSPAWDRCNGVAVDGSGNIIIGGATQGAMPGLTLGGTWDAYAMKFSPAGTGLWTIEFTDTLSLGALTVAVDGSGNVILAGHSGGTIPGQTNAGYDDAWVRKLTPAGTELWTHEFGSPEPDWAFGVAADGSGNIILAGGAEGPLPGQTSAGLQDAWVRKYSPAGVELWTSQFGTPALDRAWAVAVDGNGNILVVGHTEGGTFPGQTSAGLDDCFVRKLSPACTVLWTRQFGSPAQDRATAVTTDGAGNVIVAGYTYGPMPGQTYSGSADAFVTKFSPEGAALWTSQFGTTVSDEALGAAVDGKGNIFVAGWTEGALRGQTNAGGDDAFVREFSASGAELWTSEFGTPESELVTGVAADGSGNIFVSGETYGAFPGQTNAGSWDGFVVRVGQPAAP